MSDVPVVWTYARTLDNKGQWIANCWYVLRRVGQGAPVKIATVNFYSHMGGGSFQWRLLDGDEYSGVRGSVTTTLPDACSAVRAAFDDLKKGTAPA